MKRILIRLFSLSIILGITGCGKFNPFGNNNETVRTVDKLEYSADPEQEIVNFNSHDGSTTVMMGKFIPNNKEYMYMFLLKNGIWIGTKTNFLLGDTLTLDQMCVTVVPTKKINGNLNKIN